MAILKVRDADGKVTEIPAIKGKSAYEYAKDGGYTGTEEEFAEKMANGVGGLVGEELTQAEYDALPEEEKNNGLYFITDGVYEGETFKLVDTITYTGSFVSTASTSRPSTMFCRTNIEKLSNSAFAILEHTVNKDWFMMFPVSIDRKNLGVWVNFYNYYSGELSGTVTIRIYDIG